MTLLPPRRGPDVLVEVEDVVRVVRVLQRRQSGQLLGRVRAADTCRPLVVQSVDVRPAGEGVERAAVPACRCDPGLVLVRAVPPRGADELERGVAVAERAGG